ncbi:hypothetical protein PINS_up007324 [Pythium insidiosum]|nr:hypothetical protein PINS_up007324 [Pythium insidiosum]
MTMDDDEEEKDEPLEKLEARPRRPGWENKKKVDLTTKLPVKFMDGSVRPNKLLNEEDKSKAQAAKEAQAAEQEEEEEEEEEEELGSDVSDMEFEEVKGEDDDEDDETSAGAAPQPEKTVSAVDLQLQRQRRLAAKKIEIAQLCESIVENPEDALKKNKEHPKGLSKVQELHALCSDDDYTVRKLSMLSELSVFLDILPDYRIRLQPEQEKQNGRPLKKKVQQMQDYEASMLNNYQTFLKFCAQVVKDGLKGKNPNVALTPEGQRDVSLAETAAKCLAELLKVKYAFNFHLNLIIALVPLADSHYASIREAACESFETVFQADKSCTASLEIVKQISSYVRQKEHRVKGDIIRTFLKMPLEVTMEQGEASRKKAKSDRKKRRKLQSEGDSIASGLKEAEAVVDRHERDKTQADILHELVLIYFRILKQATYSTALPAVLEGLGKFAFLINLDIMIDLLKVLKAVLKEDILPLPSAFQAVLTGLRTLQGPGQELQVDDKEFVDILYKLLRRFSEGEDRSCLPVALQCVEAVFLRRKEIVVDRVAAFVKRLLLIAMSLEPHQILAVLALPAQPHAPLHQGPAAARERRRPRRLGRVPRRRRRSRLHQPAGHRMLGARAAGDALPPDGGVVLARHCGARSESAERDAARAARGVQHDYHGRVPAARTGAAAELAAPEDRAAPATRAQQEQAQAEAAARTQVLCERPRRLGDARGLAVPAALPTTRDRGAERGRPCLSVVMTEDFSTF